MRGVHESPTYLLLRTHTACHGRCISSCPHATCHTALIMQPVYGYSEAGQPLYRLRCAHGEAATCPHQFIFPIRPHQASLQQKRDKAASPPPATTFQKKKIAPVRRASLFAVPFGTDDPRQSWVGVSNTSHKESVSDHGHSHVVGFRVRFMRA